MISELSFASKFSSVWQSLTPTLELFGRIANVSLVEHSFLPLENLIDPSRQAFLSELGFLRAHFQSFPLRFGLSATRVLESAKTRMRGLPSAAIATEPHDPTREEDSYADLLAGRISTISQRYIQDGSIEFEPHFNGCGFIDPCNGDVLAGETLIEIKNVDRAFRSIDWRQCLTYSFLDYAAGQRRISALVLLNPRRGTVAEININELAFEVSGRSFLELTEEFEHFVSDAGVSR